MRWQEGLTMHALPAGAAMRSRLSSLQHPVRQSPVQPAAKPCSCGCPGFCPATYARAFCLWQPGLYGIGAAHHIVLRQALRRTSFYPTLGPPHFVKLLLRGETSQALPAVVAPQQSKAEVCQAHLATPLCKDGLKYPLQVRVQQHRTWWCLVTESWLVQQSTHPNSCHKHKTSYARS